MEPADERREHTTEVECRRRMIIRPQWSPPMNGGSTPRPEILLRLQDIAAMEPADERREHMAKLTKQERAELAAMEPADERREHPDLKGMIKMYWRAAMEPADERREHLDGEWCPWPPL